MAKCAHCGATILFGGTPYGNAVFCNDKCLHQGVYAREAQHVPEEMVDDLVRQIHEGECPVCGGPGPIDFHFSHRVMSFLVVTQYQTNPRISCRGCGSSAKIKDFFVTTFVGWWGIPFGVILTPIYMIRNLFGLAAPSSLEPSEHLREHAKLILAHHLLTQPAEEKTLPEETY